MLVIYEVRQHHLLANMKLDGKIVKYYHVCCCSLTYIFVGCSSIKEGIFPSRICPLLNFIVDTTTSLRFSKQKIVTYWMTPTIPRARFYSNLGT